MRLKCRENQTKQLRINSEHQQSRVRGEAARLFAQAADLILEGLHLALPALVLLVEVRDLLRLARFLSPTLPASAGAERDAEGDSEARMLVNVRQRR